MLLLIHLSLQLVWFLESAECEWSCGSYISYPSHTVLKFQVNPPILPSTVVQLISHFHIHISAILCSPSLPKQRLPHSTDPPLRPTPTQPIFSNSSPSRELPALQMLPVFLSPSTRVLNLFNPGPMAETAPWGINTLAPNKNPSF